MQRIVNGHHEPGCTAGVSFYYNICVIYYVRWPICPLLSLCTFFFMCIPTLPSVLWRCWLGGRKGIRPIKNLVWWGTGMVICLERDADLHMAQLMPLLLTVSCFSKIQIGFTFLVPAYPGGPGKRAVIRGCVCVFQHCLSYDASSNPSKIFFTRLLIDTAHIACGSTKLSAVCPSVCPIIRLPHAAAVSLLLWAQQAGDVDWLLHCWTHSSNCKHWVALSFTETKVLKFSLRPNVWSET